jgi:hypothetical protein
LVESIALLVEPVVFLIEPVVFLVEPLVFLSVAKDLKVFRFAQDDMKKRMVRARLYSAFAAPLSLPAFYLFISEVNRELGLKERARKV